MSKKEMSKKGSMRSYTLYFVLCLVILWVLTYIGFSFVMADFNSFNWSQSVRGGMVLTMVIVLALIPPMSQLVKMGFE